MKHEYMNGKANTKNTNTWKVRPYQIGVGGETALVERELRNFANAVFGHHQQSIALPAPRLTHNKSENENKIDRF